MWCWGSFYPLFQAVFLCLNGDQNGHYCVFEKQILVLNNLNFVSFRTAFIITYFF